MLLWLPHPPLYHEAHEHSGMPCVQYGSKLAEMFLMHQYLHGSILHATESCVPHHAHHQGITPWQAPLAFAPQLHAALQTLASPAQLFEAREAPSQHHRETRAVRASSIGPPGKA